jgi:hypothetical protein
MEGVGGVLKRNLSGNNGSAKNRRVLTDSLLTAVFQYLF